MPKSWPNIAIIWSRLPTLSSRRARSAKPHWLNSSAISAVRSIKLKKPRPNLNARLRNLPAPPPLSTAKPAQPSDASKLRWIRRSKLPKKLSSEPKTSEQICRNSWKSLMIPLPTRWPKSASLKISFPNSTTSWKAFPVALPTALQPLPMS